MVQSLTNVLCMVLTGSQHSCVGDSFSHGWSALGDPYGKAILRGFGCPEGLWAARAWQTVKAALGRLLGPTCVALCKVAATGHGCISLTPFRVLQTPQSGCLPSPAFQSSGFPVDPPEYLRHSRPENSRPLSPS